MPRQSKGARLYLQPEQREKSGYVRPAVWLIRDGRKRIVTGCGAGAREEAERKLADYLAAKYEPARRERPLSSVRITDVISVYLDDVAPRQANPAKAAERAGRLLEFWGTKMLSAVSGASVRDYISWRGTNGGARRDLQDFQAAINYAHKEGLFRESVRIPLPPAGAPRTRWLTRSEVARLVLTCLTTRETQEGKATKKRPLLHVARFILIGVYTGSRPGDILGLSWEATTHRGRVDLDQGMIYRKPTAKRETTKRQPPVPVSPPLLRLLRRWSRFDGDKGPVVYHGDPAKPHVPILSVKTAMGRAVKLAGLDTGVTAYTLRHTTGSWLVQAGVSTRKVAEVLGTSEQMIERHYGHLAPHHLRDEVAVLGRKPQSAPKLLRKKDLA